MRPRTLDEFAGQEHLLAEGKPLRTDIERGTVSSMVFWGRPGAARPRSAGSSRSTPTVSSSRSRR
jgi:replication-associated recombination protein RarA